MALLSYWFCSFKHLDAVLLHLPVILAEEAKGFAGSLLRLAYTNAAEYVAEF